MYTAYLKAKDDLDATYRLKQQSIDIDEATADKAQFDAYVKLAFLLMRV